MNAQQKPEFRDLTLTELKKVSGAMPFFGMNCSMNQQNGIGAVRDAAGSVPIVGGFLSAVVTAVGRGLCS